MKISANGIHFHVEERGAGKNTLIFLHYFGGSSRSWGEVMALLQDEFRCLAPDLRGFGDSDATATGYSVNEGADDVAALIAALQIERYTLVGHSMGGKIALALAARRPAGLERLVLLAPSPPTPEPMEDEERQRLLDGYGKRDAAQETLRKVTAMPLSTVSQEQAIENTLQASPQAWRAWLNTGSREDISPLMKRIHIPVLVVAGECDHGMTPTLLQREVVARVDGATFTTIAGAGHLLPLEAPASVTTLLMKNYTSSEIDKLSL